MTSTAIMTMTKMMEMLPETAQDQALEYLRNYIVEMQSEQRWDKLFSQTQEQLMAAARQARKEIAEGRAKPMDFDRL
ncbi:MAG: hypothetical protein M9928_08620 [Anaerolineae bacterium]|nr:hypothetical protein [Anaerolineae bacterium]MCO5190842.1 hypothetical protein [Anaerolineae bacterium]MCO5205080.1 hypothetical protein [Anaerolineae bacterium]